MISFKLNKESISIPSSWSEVTISQYSQMLSVNDDVIKVVSILTGKDYETLKKATILGLDKLLEAISFINKPIDFPAYVDQVGPYKLPPNHKGKFNVQHESLGQFEDARQVLKLLDGTLPSFLPTLLKVYVKLVSIYLQKIRDKEYDPLKVPTMEEEVQKFPAYQVMALGAFFFLKSRSLSTTTKTISPTSPATPSKKKRALTNSHKHSGHSQRSPKRR